MPLLFLLYHSVLYVLYLLFGKNLLFVHCLASECGIPTNQPLKQAIGTISTSQLCLVWCRHVSCL